MAEDLLSNKNVLEPQLVWRGSRCFRAVGDYQQGGQRGTRMLEELEEVNMIESLEGDEAAANTWDIQQTRNGQFEAAINIPSMCYGSIIGPKGSKKKEMENATRTRITIPNRGQEGPVVVTGSSKEGVGRACVRLAMVVTEKRNRIRPTHFLCVYTNTEAVQQCFAKFQEEAGSYPNINKILFQSPMKLHLTLAMLTLLDDDEVAVASRFIEKFTIEQIKPMTSGEPIAVSLRGVDIMRDDPKDTNVLFCRVEEGASKEILEKIAIQFMKSWSETPLSVLSTAEPHVKLHMTLMNSKFVARAEEEAAGLEPLANGRGRVRNTFSFDATEILENFKDFDFGTVTVQHVALAECNASARDGAHKRVSEHKFV